MDPNMRRGAFFGNAFEYFEFPYSKCEILHSRGHGSFEGLVGEEPPCPKETKYIAALYGP